MAKRCPGLLADGLRSQRNCVACAVVGRFGSGAILSVPALRSFRRDPKGSAFRTACSAPPVHVSCSVAWTC